MYFFKLFIGFIDKRAIQDNLFPNFNSKFVIFDTSQSQMKANVPSYANFIEREYFKYICKPWKHILIYESFKS